MVEIQKKENSEDADSWVRWLSRTILVVFTLELFRGILRRRPERSNVVVGVRSPPRHFWRNIFWTFLSMLFFFFGLFLIWNYIYLQLEPHDDPITLNTESDGVYMSCIPLKAQTMGYNVTIKTIRSELVSNTSINYIACSFKGDPLWQHKHYFSPLWTAPNTINCSPTYNILLEGGSLKCDNSLSNLTDTIRIYSKRTIHPNPPNSTIQSYLERCRLKLKVCLYPFPIPINLENFCKLLDISNNDIMVDLQESGPKRLDISSFWECERTNTSKSPNQESFEGRFNGSSDLVYDSTFYVRSHEEVNQQETTRTTYLAVSILALFGIIPAVKALRDLVENNK